MTTKANAAVLAVGDELTLGHAVDTNSAWISARLLSMGVRVIEHATVDDDLARLAGAIERLAGAAGLVVVTGGLGPTADDLTRQALALALGETLVEDAGALAEIRAWYAGRGEMPSANRVQALRPASARMLSNTHGTAPGLAARIERLGAEVYCLPGPPREMAPMFERWVAPALAASVDGVIQTRLLLTHGLGESAIADALGPIMDRERPSRGLPLVGTTASGGVVVVRLRHRTERAAAAVAALDLAEQDIVDRIGHAVFDRRDPAAGDSADTSAALASAVVRRLIDRGQRLVVAESCTGGGLGAEITRVPGASATFLGGWLTYSNAAKTRLLSVPEEVIARDGAVSPLCAMSMAAGALVRSGELCPGPIIGADHALAITGVAGPDGGTSDKPVGTVWIARGSTTGVDVRRFLFRGDRDEIRSRAVTAALGMLRLHLDGVTMRLHSETTPTPG